MREKLGAEQLYTTENKVMLSELLALEGKARTEVESAEELLLDSMEALEKANEN